MTAAQFREWCAVNHLSRSMIADALRVHSRTVQRWRDHGTSARTDVSLYALFPEATDAA